ncbi:hypothetical protein HY024_04195 [Candidatus Curtissbacteria bacterium]|nr:hypothetical protein [Candidatus Curtissbacteria bacterium]
MVLLFGFLGLLVFIFLLSRSLSLELGRGLYQRFAATSPDWWIHVIFYYIVFQVGNGMFSSRRDMEGALELGVAVLILIIVLYFLGIRLPNPSTFENTTNQASGIFRLGVDVLLRIVFVDLALILVCRGGNFLLRRR